MATIGLRGGLLVDGTGADARRGDLLITDHLITAMGDDVGPADTDIDMTGLVVAPGFIDPHTHFDAQVMWDRDLTPSSSFGFTTVIMGNCGFTVAPTRPNHREKVIAVLENVEGMSPTALAEGIDWTFETFEEYLEVLRRMELRLNVGAMIGHTAVRFYVMGEDADRRAATDGEVAAMRAIVRGALEAGAVGFSTSTTTAHVGVEGRPVPSRLATVEEIFEIARALGDAGTGVMEVSMGPPLTLELLADISKEIQRPITWTSVRANADDDRDPVKLLDLSESLGGEMWPQIGCRDLVMQIQLLSPGWPLTTLDAFEAIYRVPRSERRAVYEDAAWRRRALPQIQSALGRFWEVMTIEETTAHASMQGRTVASIAAEQAKSPEETFVDLAIEDQLLTRFKVVLGNSDKDKLGRLLADRRSFLALSDAGAHADMMCDAAYSLTLLAEWVRGRGILTLEDAIWRLTGHPASVFGLHGRGQLCVGAPADIVAFDLARVDSTELRRVWDFPAGSDRLIADAIGVEHVWVNGTQIRADSKDVPDARPGVVLRGGA